MLLLALSGSIAGLLSDVIYGFAFILPALLCFCFVRKNKLSAKPMRLLPSRRGILLTSLIAAPLITLVFLASALFSFLFSLVGIESSASLSGSLPYLIFVHALLPAFLEELLFRYIPLSLLSHHSKRSAILFSAILFAFAHCNLIQIPYAFIAGLAFASVDIATGSILPSFILHFLNNLVSVIWQSGMIGEGRVALFIAIFGSLSILSVLLLFALGRRISADIKPIFDRKDKIAYSSEVLIFMAFCGLISVLTVF